MKKILLSLLVVSFCYFGNAQKTSIKPAGTKQLNYLGKSVALKEKVPMKSKTFVPPKPSKKKDYKGETITYERDAAVQDLLINGDSIQCIKNFEGVGTNAMPNPDTEGDVGPDHYFQMVKRSFGIWDKQGNILYGPADNQTLWSDFSGPWDDMGWTDPIVIYDHLADRWLASCMVYEVNVEYYEMIAISATSDPLGEYYCYSMWFETMPDYPKFGLWPDGYYLTVNEADVAGGWGTFAGASIIVFNREQLIAGEPDPQVIYFHLEAPLQSFTGDISSFLPSDLDGPLPPEGTPNYHVCVRDNAWGWPEDRIWIWECVIDWNDTSNCNFSELAILEPETFDSHFPDHIYIHQPQSSVRLHSLSYFLMYRLQYRNFGDYQTLVCNHTVEVDGAEHGAVRWYELRNEGNGWLIHQQSSLAPDEDSRWMGSMAIDKDGNIGLGYSVSGDVTYPSIRITGQRYNDELNVMSFTESEVITGSASQTMHGRWGDYSTMSVDPVDDLTFWYTQEYIDTPGPTNWKTRIVSFQLHKNPEFSPDSLIFATIEECLDGKQLIIKNSSMYSIEVEEIQESGSFGSAVWHIQDFNYNFPFELTTADSLVLNIIVDLPTLIENESYISDSLMIITDYKTYKIPLYFNEDLLTSTENSIEKNELLNIYPNPFKQYSFIEFNLTKPGPVKVEIFSNELKIVWEIKLSQAVQGNNQIIWRGINNQNERVPAGLYFLRMTSENKSIVKKLILN